MKKFIYSFAVLIILFFLGFSIYIFKSIGNEEYPFAQYVKSFISSNIKDTLKSFLNLDKDHHGNLVLKESLEDKYDIYLKKKYINFKKISEETLKVNNTVLKFQKFQSKNLNKFSKHPEFYAKGSSYLDIYKQKLFLVTGHGLVFFEDIKNFDSSKKVKLQQIETNIKDIVKYKEFYSNSLHGIKDIFIYNDLIYVSYVNQLKEKCLNTSILVGKINFEKIQFENFFSPNECILENTDPAKWWEGQSGGRMIVVSDNEVLFTTGEFRSMIKAQDKSNVFGKILSINIKNKSYEVISLGHRNPQGLFYDKDNDILFSTEHGPTGGDELNINIKPKEKLKNFGWPISSYGYHYYPSDELTKIAPLFKSHIKYGFEEPLKEFTPSIGVSQVIRVPQNLLNSKNYNILVGGMGKNIDEGDLSLHFFSLNNNFKIEKHHILPINERVRDIVVNNSNNKIYLFLETSGSIGIIEK